PAHLKVADIHYSQLYGKGHQLQQFARESKRGPIQEVPFGIDPKQLFVEAKDRIQVTGKEVVLKRLANPVAAPDPPVEVLEEEEDPIVDHRFAGEPAPAAVFAQDVQEENPHLGGGNQEEDINQPIQPQQPQGEEQPEQEEENQPPGQPPQQPPNQPPGQPPQQPHQAPPPQ